MVGSCAALATLIGTFDAAGKSISGAYSHGQPIFGAKATEHGVAIEGQGPEGENAGAGERGWREERARRREKFFKVSDMDGTDYFVKIWSDEAFYQPEEANRNGKRVSSMSGKSRGGGGGGKKQLFRSTTS